jgi:hypothetical protein
VEILQGNLQLPQDSRIQDSFAEAARGDHHFLYVRHELFVWFSWIDPGRSHGGADENIN